MKHLFSWSGLAALLVLFGCDADSKTAAPDSIQTNDVSADVPSADVPADQSAAGYTVSVSYGGQTADVPLTGLATATIDGAQVVTLDTILTAADLGITSAAVTLDFESVDGFHPGDSPNCTTAVPVAGTAATQGGLTPDVGNLLWDPALDFPGCLRVDNVALILVADP